jgi:hypothetical protein
MRNPEALSVSPLWIRHRYLTVALVSIDSYHVLHSYTSFLLLLASATVFAAAREV